MRQRSLPLKPKTRQAFTLTEMTIVLLIISSLIAAIWVAAGKVWNNYRVYRVNQQMIQVVQNIRDTYASVQQLPGSATDITATLDGLSANSNVNIFPSEMRRSPNATPGNSVIDHAINNNYPNGSFHVLSQACSGSASTALRCFRIEIQGLTQVPCTQLLLTAPLANTEMGITQAQAGVTGQSFTVFNITNPQIAINAPTASSAVTACSGTSTGMNTDNNEVDFDFKLHN